jgi:hypothetical protein
VEGDPFPEIEIMKWKGDDSTRSEALSRFIEKGVGGLGTGDAANVEAFGTEVERVLDGADADTSVSGNQPTNPRGAAERSSSLAARSREYAELLIQADPGIRKALKTPVRVYNF